jgi:hypothetical protein
MADNLSVGRRFFFGGNQILAGAHSFLTLCGINKPAILRGAAAAVQSKRE